MRFAPWPAGPMLPPAGSMSRSLAIGQTRGPPPARGTKFDLKAIVFCQEGWCWREYCRFY